jgi:P27 family predicted phage terminase small subunit
MAGRNRVPNEAKKLAGTYRPDRAHSEPNTQRPAKCPSAPAGMNDAEKLIWKDVAKACYNMGILANSDLFELRLLVENMHLLNILKQDIELNGVKINVPDSQGNVKIVTNPAMVSYQIQLKTVNTLMQQFGLTPVSRTKATPTGGVKNSDPMMLLMNKKKGKVV